MMSTTITLIRTVLLARAFCNVFFVFSIDISIPKWISEAISKEEVSSLFKKPFESEWLFETILI